MSEHKSFVTTAELDSGWAAVVMWWSPVFHGSQNPPCYGVIIPNDGLYATKAEAIAEAKEIAETEGLEYLEPCLSA